VHGLTTAAAIWEYAAIGMAAAAGLVKLAIVVTILHFVIVLGFTPLTKRLTARLAGSVRLHIAYEQNRGVIGRIRHAPSAVAGVDGVTSVRRMDDKDD